MELKEIFPLIFSVTLFTIIITILSTFVEMLTNTNIETKLMPLKKNVRDSVYLMSFISIVLSMVMHLGLAFSGEITLLTLDEETKQYSIEFETILSFITFTVVLLGVFLIITILILAIGKIISVNVDYIVLFEEETTEWKIIKSTYDGKILIKKKFTNTNKKRVYMIVDNLNSVSIRENVVLSGWKKKLYTKNFKLVLTLSILCFSGSFLMALFLEKIVMHWSLWLMVTLIGISGLSVTIYLISFKENLKKLGLIDK